MGFLDRFRQAPQPAKTPRGSSGRGHYTGFLQLEEANLELAGIQGLRVYDRMWRTDPDVRRVGSMMINPILAATWTIVPYGEDEAADKDRKAAELVRWALFEGMRPGLPGHLAEALPVLIRSGFSPFEQIWHVVERDGRQVQVPRKLGLRLPRTIVRFHQDKFGDLHSVVQQLPTSGEVTLPAQDLLYYRVGAEGDNWEGTSLLRPVYKPWFWKDGIERLDAIAQEREATGYPVVYPPGQDIDDDILDDLEDKIAGIRAGDTGYLMMPGPRAQDIKENPGAGWHFELVGYGGTQGGRQALPTLEYHRDGIAAAFVAEFMRLGQSGEGARATADVQQDPFLAGVEALAAVVEGPINEELIPRICALNLDVDEPPKLQMSLVDSTSLTELKEYVTGLVEKGAMQPDHPLEDYLRKRADLPAADPDERTRREEERDKMAEATEKAAAAAEDEEGEDEKEPAPAKKSLAVAQRADGVRWFEQLMALDAISEAIDGARDQFQRHGGPLALALARDVAANGKAPRPADLEVALTEVLGDLYATGRHTVAAELDAQRQGLVVFPANAYRLARRQPGDPPESVFERARLAATAIANRIVQAVARRRLAGHATDADLQVVAEREATAGLRAEAIAHAAPALNAGRAEEAAEHPDIAGTYYTSILDTSRCASCRKADDDIFRRLTDPVRIARQPPNPLCEGGGACRCMEAYVLHGEAPMDLRALGSDHWRAQRRDPGGQGGGRWVAHTTDAAGRTVTLPARILKKILSAHPDMASHTREVLPTVANPDHDEQDPHESGRRWRYYKEGVGPGAWLRVVVEYGDAGGQVVEGQIVTAFGQRRPPQ